MTFIKKILDPMERNEPSENRRKALIKTLILIVDDEETQSRTLQKQLQHMGYRCYSVPSGMNAFVFLQNYQVDVIVTDDLTPGIHGNTFLKNIIGQGLIQSIPVILLGRTRDPEIRQSVMPTDMFPTMSNPYDIRELSEFLRDTLSQQNKHSC